jgi:transcriptional antiterminator NusG
MAKKWYVVKAMSGQERKVRSNIEARIDVEELGDYFGRLPGDKEGEEEKYAVLIPTENVSEVKAGKKKITTRLFFPGYILVEMELNERTYHFIRQTNGVLGFLGEQEPISLKDDEIADILGQIEAKKEKVKPKVMFEIGEPVKVTEGPFVNFSGVINEINPDKGKLKVMVSIFGRSTPLELEYWQVERA